MAAWTWRRIRRGLRRRAGVLKRRVRGGGATAPAGGAAKPAFIETAVATGHTLDITRPVRLLIGPANMAGQGWQWARAAEHFLDGVSAESLTAARSRPGFQFRTDTVLSGPQQRGDLTWHRDRVVREVTHVLFEAGRPILRDFHAGSMSNDVDELRAAGLHLGAVFHGSEVRDPSKHRELYPVTAFDDPREDLTERLQVVVDDVQERIARFDGPRFVSTPDLLDFVPDAIWMPVVVGVDEFATDNPVLERPKPVVLHAPSNSALKGTSFIDPALQSLHDDGLIEYRRASGLPHAELVELVKDCDIVVDQAVLGLYGVFAAESMAAGRVTLAHVAPHVRARVPVELPIVEITPPTVRDVIAEIVRQRDEAIKTAHAGVEFARMYHDGRMAARALAGFLGREERP
ncbi:hypothetical protein [Jiangella alkaliphila]|uniref:Uncharacterized protein n=1 Tax=Jiangella alkaliphila TaxID=419479 RepID=A0A1H2LZY5_9ACTN|nr:hypothetical protein [Jiangella alkaliphila]SDU86563.1 hypothetical protein SAMN04488563_6899 [Jiangella alkaliphila]